MIKFFLVSINNEKIAYKVSKDGAIFYDSPKALMTRNLVDYFNEEDRDKILSLCDISNNSKLKTKESYLLVLIFALFLSCLFSAIPLSQTKAFIFNSIQPAGILIFPLTFIFLDTINEVFGRKQGRLAVYTASACMAISAAFITISLNFIVQQTTEHDSFITVFKELPKLLIINSLCVLIADTVNNFTYNLLKGYLRGKLLALRCYCSTLIGQFFYSITWIFLFFFEKLSTEEKISYIFANYGFKVLYGLAVCTPLTLLTVYIVKRVLYKGYVDTIE
ncbi:TPA: queuosine precursor transporter [Serratia marcescens]|nr:membrane protein [Serratia marcescens]HEI8504924.1 queuosine precursor transporter [Serratia marcescens]